MADQTMGSGVEVAAIIPEIWSSRFYEVLLQKLPFQGIIDQSYSGDIQALGDIVNISSIPQFSDATLLAECAKNDADAVTVTGQQLVIDKCIVKDAIVCKKAQLQSLDFMDELRDKMIYAIAKKVETEIIAEINPVPANQIAYDAGTTLALADLLEGKELLDCADVPEEGRAIVTGCSQVNDLFNINGFTSRDFVPAGSPLATGGFATPILGFELNWSTLVGDNTYMFHPSFITMAMQRELMVEQFNLGVNGVRGTRINASNLMGIQQLDGNRVVQIS